MSLLAKYSPHATSRATTIARTAWRIPNWFERLYFDPIGPAALAICRIWIYGFLLIHSVQLDYYRWAEFPPGLWEPIWLMAWLGKPPSPEFAWGWQMAYVVALAFSSLGLGFRWAAPAAFFLGLFLYTLPNSFGKVDHSHTLSVFALGILALSHAGQVWSLDAWLAARRGCPAPPSISSEYRWPIILLQALMATVFLAAGIAKLRQSGLAWISSNQLQYLLLDGFYTGKEPPTNLGLWVAQLPMLCQIVAGTTVLLELTAPLAVLSRRYRWFVVPSLFGMQLGIYLAMGVNFWQFLGLYVVWIDWNGLAAAAGFSREGHLARSEATNALPRRVPGRVHSAAASSRSSRRNTATTSSTGTT